MTAAIATPVKRCPPPGGRPETVLVLDVQGKLTTDAEREPGSMAY